SCSPKSTCSSATGTQENRCSWIVRCSASRPSMSANSTAPTTNDAIDAAQPNRWPQLSVRRPPIRRIAAPTNGSAIVSHTGVVIVPLVFQQIGVVDGGRAARAEDGHDDREANHHLACGDD